MSIAILYEHPEWFTPLFNVLRRRGIAHQPLDATTLTWDPSRRPPFDLLVNRMSPSAYLRGHRHAVHSVARYLEYVEAYDVPIVNGLDTYRMETSKSSQLDLFEKLGVPYPRARVFNHPGQALDAARDLRFPVVVKPNIGGSGAGIQRFETPAQLRTAVEGDQIDLGLDDTALVQEFIPARGGSIARVELLDRRLLYAIRITPPQGFGFNLCPADICRDEPGSAESSDAATDGADASTRDASMCPTKPAMTIEAVTAPASVVDRAVAIAEAASLDICGIEYLEDDRDGTVYFYDVNALSNFVTDAPNIVGFDPFETFADYLERRWHAARPVREVAAEDYVSA